MYLVSVPRICKITMRASCGETTSKVACEFSAFYNFVENSITLSLVYVSKSNSSRDFEKFQLFIGDISRFCSVTIENTKI